MNQKLVIDDIHVGYVKRYYRQNDSWIFVLDTISTAIEDYQIQVVVPLDNIKLFTSANGLEIILRKPGWKLTDRLYNREHDEVLTVADFIEDYEAADAAGIVSGGWEANLEYSIRHGILERIG